MRFRGDRLVESLRELLPESERRQVAHVTARLPTFAQIGLALQRHHQAAGRIALLVPAGDTVDGSIERGGWVYHTSKIRLVAESGLRVRQNLVSEIVASIDGPKISQAHGFSSYGAVPDIRGQEAAVARLLLQGFIEVWGVKDWKIF